MSGMCYWNVVLKLTAICLEDSRVKVTFCLGDMVIFHDTWMYGLMCLRGWTVRKVRPNLKDTFSVLSLTTWWHRSPAWNTQGKNARKYSYRRNLNKILGANRVFAATVRVSSPPGKPFGHVCGLSTLVLWYRFIAGNSIHPQSSRLLANFERMIQINLEEKIDA